MTQPQPWPDSESTLRAVDDRVRSGDAKGALRHLFELLRIDPANADALSRAAELTSSLGAGSEALLFRKAAEDPDDPQAMYDLGYLFVESGLPSVGTAYLERCLQREPDHPLVRYELAYAKFILGAYDEAQDLLDRLVADESLAGAEAFAAALLRVECLLYRGQPDAASDAFEAVDVKDAGPDGESQLDAVANLLARAAQLPAGEARDARDWHFIEQGGIVMNTGEDRPDAWVPALASLDYLARMVVGLADLLHGLDAIPSSVAFAGGEMAPVAEVLAAILAVEVAPLNEGDSPGLVLVKDPQAAGPFLDQLRRRDEGGDLFALYLDPRREYAVSPEIVGQFAVDLRLPWEREQNPGMDAEPEGPAIPPERAADELAAAVLRIQPNGYGALVDYYRGLRDHLTFGNHDRHPARRMFTPRRTH